jgi:hypothetical protein
LVNTTLEWQIWIELGKEKSFLIRKFGGKFWLNRASDKVGVLDWSPLLNTPSASFVLPASFFCQGAMTFIRKTLVRTIFNRGTGT